MTTAELVAILKEPHALEQAAAAIAGREDLTHAYTWQCVIAAIRDRRQKLLNYADAQLNEPVRRDAQVSITSHVPPGRVH